jgi:hypothetical protein
VVVVVVVMGRGGGILGLRVRIMGWIGVRILRSLGIGLGWGVGMRL